LQNCHKAEGGYLTGVRKVNDMQARASGSAELLLLNGRIWTGVPPGAPASREVEALALRDGRVLASGYSDELRALAGPGTTVVDLGIPVAAGSDSTRACSENPWLSLWWLVTGRPLDGGPRRDPRQRLSRAEALDLYTRAGAWFSFEEDRRGMLQPGRLADLAVLSDDFLTCDEEAIPSLESELTLVGGRVAHASPVFSGLAGGAENAPPAQSATVAASSSHAG
jgi:predicted amidohydrolase YtcJ